MENSNMWRVMVCSFFLPLMATSFEDVDRLIETAIAEHAFPSAQLLVEHHGQILHHKAYGTPTYESTERTTVDHVYDLASLTKVIATTSCLMKLYEEGRLQLDDPLKHYLPRFSAHGKGAISLRQLLLHTSGLAPFLDQIASLQSTEEVEEAIAAETLRWPKGTRSVYSDLNFFLLGKVIEAIVQQPLDRYFHTAFAQPLGVQKMGFCPLPSPLYIPTLVHPPSSRPLVHDPMAALLGGVSGHAGLFSTAAELGTFLSNLPTLLSPQTITLFTTLQPESQALGATRAMGWDTPSAVGSSVGKGWGPRTYGHTGFTGTSLWIDPDQELLVVFLTNRVYPNPDNAAIRQVRPQLHEAILKFTIL